MKAVVICCPEYDQSSGGSVVLHELAAMLETVTRVVRVNLVPVRSSGTHGWTLTAQNVEESTLQLCRSDAAIVIYPETVYGNPLGGWNVIRWLLNTPGLICDTYIDYRTETIYSYLESFGACFPLLRISSIPQMPEVSNTKNVSVSYLIKKAYKYHNTAIDTHESWQCIDGMSLSEQLLILSQSKYFISFDPHTMLSTFATLVGCRSIVPEVSGKSQSDLYSDDEISFVYGDYSGVDFSSLMQVAHRFVDTLRETTTKDFISFCGTEL